jgi:hypothetical protein
MAKFWISLAVAPAFLLSVNTSVFADAEAEKYVEDALPLMYHSCESVVEEAAGDNAYIDKVIRSLVAVSLYNRDVEISRFEISDEAKNALHDKFVALLKAGCEADHDALLAGVIDKAVSDALAGK